MGYIGVPYFQTIPSLSGHPALARLEARNSRGKMVEAPRLQPNAPGYGCSMGDEFSDWVKIGT
jgi:hypothetical protein